MYLVDPSNGVTLAYTSDNLVEGKQYEAFRCAAEYERGRKPEFTIPVIASNSADRDNDQILYMATIYVAYGKEYIEFF